MRALPRQDFVAPAGRPWMVPEDPQPEPFQPENLCGAGPPFNWRPLTAGAAGAALPAG